jgi:hypothetical protein
MTNCPAPREIPAGKILVAEYSDLTPDNRQQLQVVAKALPRPDFPGRNSVSGNIKLVWSSPGFQPAGSCCTWTNGFWAVWIFMADGTRHRRRYPPDDDGEAKAREHFRHVTQGRAAA